MVLNVIKSVIILLILINCSSALDAVHGEKDVFDGCNFQGKESVHNDNVNCTKLPMPNLWNEQSNKRCVQEYIKGCQLAKIEHFCRRGSSDQLNEQNTKCEPLKQEHEYGLEFYVLCCNVCAKGKQSYSNKQSCKRDLPLNAELTQIIAQNEFENCCTSKATNGLRSVSEMDDDYFEDNINVCDKFGCEQFCQELDIDKAVCTCGPGYLLNRDGKKCNDIDECLNPQLNICGPNQQCRNLIGTYECVDNVIDPKDNNTIINDTSNNRTLRNNLDDLTDGDLKCQSNEYFDPHRNKCIEIIDKYENFCSDEKCDSSMRAQLDNTTKCPDGHKVHEESGFCEDIDECVANTCAQNETCVNKIGDFECINSTQVINCQTGLVLNGDRCEDVNECLNQTIIEQNCGKEKNCINLLGSYKCADRANNHTLPENSSLQSRDAGFPFTQIPSNNETLSTNDGTNSVSKECDQGQDRDSSGECADIDVCLQSPGICGENATCRMVFGKHECECVDGFLMTEISNQTNSTIIKKCIDIDECQESNYCTDLTSTCKNTIGSYECECKPGYMNSLTGSYKCECREGFALQSDNRTCIERNLCEDGHKFCDGICEKNGQDYVCKKCNIGFKFDGDKKKCVSIDDCKDGISCDDPKTCIDLKKGQSRCIDLSCPADYTEDNAQGEKICFKDKTLLNKDALALSKRVIILPLEYVNQSRTIYRSKKPEETDNVHFNINLITQSNDVNLTYFAMSQEKMSNNLILNKPIDKKQDIIVEITAIYKEHRLHQSILYVFVV